MKKIIHITDLSPREIEILSFVSKGWSSKQIAETLYLSSETISTHRKNILRKTGAPNMMTVVAMAMQRNLLKRITKASIPAAPVERDLIRREEAA